MYLLQALSLVWGAISKDTERAKKSAAVLFGSLTTPHIPTCTVDNMLSFVKCSTGTYALLCNTEIELYAISILNSFFYRKTLFIGTLDIQNDAANVKALRDLTSMCEHYQAAVSNIDDKVQTILKVYIFHIYYTKFSTKFTRVSLLTQCTRFVFFLKAIFSTALVECILPLLISYTRLQNLPAPIDEQTADGAGEGSVEVYQHGITISVVS